MQIDVGYPDLEAERRMLIETTGARQEEPRQIMDVTALIEAERLVRLIPIGERVVEGILSLVRAGRPLESDQAAVKRHVAWGPGPRASQALALAARARALLDGRLSPSLDDVVALARPVPKHRMALSFAARADGVSLDRLIDGLAARLA
jgi:MoxR-like ATPase